MATPQDPGAAGEPAAGEPYRLLVVAAESVAGPELREAVAERARGRTASVRVVAPALTETRLQHVAGSVDDAIADAQQRLERSLAELHEAGLEATGRTGDSDLNLAIQDALQDFDADEILVVAHRDDPPPLEREGIAEAERSFAAPITELYVTSERDQPHIAEVERVGSGLEEADAGDREPDSANLPPFGLRDIVGMVVAGAGTIALVVLAADCGSGESLNTRGGFGDEDGFGGCELRVLIAGAFGLLNLAHIVGLMLFQAGPYRGFWRGFFARLSLFGTPAAIVVSALIA